MTTRLHLAIDERGRVRRIVFSGGQAADVSRGLDLVQGLKPQKVIADRAYDADWLLHYLDSEGIEAVIPPKSNRRQHRDYDHKAYRGRNVIERTINRIKGYKKIVARYEKTTPSFAALCFMDATFINLSLDVNTP